MFPLDVALEEKGRPELIRTAIGIAA